MESPKVVIGNQPYVVVVTTGTLLKVQRLSEARRIAQTSPGGSFDLVESTLGLMAETLHRETHEGLKSIGMSAEEIADSLPLGALSRTLVSFLAALSAAIQAAGPASTPAVTAHGKVN